MVYLLESRGQSSLRPGPPADRARDVPGSSTQIRDPIIFLDETGAFLNYAGGVVRADIRIEFQGQVIGRILSLLPAASDKDVVSDAGLTEDQLYARLVGKRIAADGAVLGDDGRWLAWATPL